MKTKEDSKDKKKVVPGAKKSTSMVDKKPADKKSDTKKPKQVIDTENKSPLIFYSVGFSI